MMRLGGNDDDLFCMLRQRSINGNLCKCDQLIEQQLE